MFCSRLIVSLVLCFKVISAGNAPPLGKYNVDFDRVTVSGFSGGAAFASQFHVAYSSLVRGMGSWAGMANLCFAEYKFGCQYSPEGEDPNVMVNNTHNLAGEGRIDPVENMATDKVYIYHGTHDTNVHPLAADIMISYYQAFLSDPSRDLMAKQDLPSSHAVVSDHTGTECGVTNDPIYIEDCDFESTYFVLDFLLGGNISEGVSPGTWSGDLTTFDQDEFFATGNASVYSMDDTGYVYIPPNCQSKKSSCLLHVHFHGCGMFADNIGTEFMTESGFLEVADANDIIIIFPMAIRDLSQLNVYGCFDFFMMTDPWEGGFSTPDPLFYATKEAPQMNASYYMILRVGQPEDESTGNSCGKLRLNLSSALLLLVFSIANI